MTHRQYRTWKAWQGERWNCPDRTDHYLMQIAAALGSLPFRVWGKSGPLVGIHEYALTFAERGPAREMTREQAAAMSKAKWFAAVGYKRERPPEIPPEAMPPRQARPVPTPSPTMHDGPPKK